MSVRTGSINGGTKKAGTYELGHSESQQAMQKKNRKKNRKSSNRRIFVYTFYLINIRLSLSDDANKIKALNIERGLQFQLSLKI